MPRRSANYFAHDITCIIELTCSPFDSEKRCVVLQDAVNLLCCFVEAAIAKPTSRLLSASFQSLRRDTVNTHQFPNLACKLRFHTHLQKHQKAPGSFAGFPNSRMQLGFNLWGREQCTGCPRRSKSGIPSWNRGAVWNLGWEWLSTRLEHRNSIMELWVLCAPFGLGVLEAEFHPCVLRLRGRATTNILEILYDYDFGGSA